MKLKSSLPEKPGWLFVTPGFDFLLLLLALVTLTGVVAKEGFVEVNLPPSEFRGQRMGEEEFVVVTVKNGRKGPIYFVGKDRVEERNLKAIILEEATKRETDRVAVRCDRQVKVEVEQRLVDLVRSLNFRYFRATKSIQDEKK